MKVTESGVILGTASVVIVVGVSVHVRCYSRLAHLYHYNLPQELTSPDMISVR